MSALLSYADEVGGCTRCALAKGRTQVVFGAGSPTADLMFVGEAPGFHEDKQGIPFVGQAGKLLEKLLDGIGLARSDVYIANVLKCRPPGNRDPQPEEIEACETHLFRQIELIKPIVNVGLVTRSCTPSARHAPRTNVVFPAPSSPDTVTTSPLRSSAATRAASDSVSSADEVCVSTGEA